MRVFNEQSIKITSTKIPPCGNDQSIITNPQPSKNSTATKFIVGITALSFAAIASYAYYQNQDYVNQLVKEKATAGFDAFKKLAEEQGIPAFDALKTFGKNSLNYAYDKSSQLYSESSSTLEKAGPLFKNAAKILNNIAGPVSLAALFFAMKPSKVEKRVKVHINRPNYSVVHTTKSIV